MTDSFIDLLDAWGRDHPPEMTRREGEDIRRWQQRFGAKVRELLGPVPPAAEGSPRFLETVEADDHTRYRLEIPVSKISSVPAWLLVPAGADEAAKRPGLLALHGHLDYGIDSVCGLRVSERQADLPRDYALRAVRAGYVVLAPAWWGWPGRDGHLDRVGNRDRCNVIQMAAGAYGLNVIALHMQDARAALTALAEDPRVDATRLGCLGNSYGGRTGMWLALLDERIAACVLSGCVNVFRERTLKFAGCGIQFPFGLLRYGDVPELLSLIAPRAMQLQAGEADKLLNPTDRDAIFDTVGEAYRRLDAANRLESYVHPGGHYLVWEAAERFFRAHLGGA
jgi:dienelactone hydrolase